MVLRNLLLLILSCLIPSCNAVQLAHPTGVPSPVAIVYALNATVVLTKADENAIVCAGEFVTPSIVATAYHCLDSMTGCEDGNEQCYQNHEIGFYTYQDYLADRVYEPRVATVLRFKKAYDLALIQTKLEHTFVLLNPIPPIPGQPVVSIGHPHGDPFVVAMGFARQPLVFSPEPVSVISIAVAPGSSGGGLYDSDGRLLGICEAGTLNGQTGLFGVSYTVAELLLAK